jgi:hypothetical protein
VAHTPAQVAARLVTPVVERALVSLSMPTQMVYGMEKTLQLLAADGQDAATLKAHLFFASTATLATLALSIHLAL